MTAHTSTAGKVRDADISASSGNLENPIAKAETTFWRRIAWRRFLPFLALHLAALSVFWVGVSLAAVAVGLGFFFLRVFALTGFYHRYFSHRAFKTSRWLQLIGAVLGNMAAQRGPLWWAAHHREHHRTSDRPEDVHSPRQHGFWWSHLGWFLATENLCTQERRVKDWIKFPELVFLDRHHLLAPLLAAGGMYGLGWACAVWLPALGTDGLQMLVWGFLISTLALYHVTYAVNSIAHEFGSRRFSTKDDSRNSLLLALVTFGEGWHNNHHRYPVSARQGFYWWEVDVTYYILRGLSLLGLVWELKPVPGHVLAEGRGLPETSPQGRSAARSTRTVSTSGGGLS